MLNQLTEFDQECCNIYLDNLLNCGSSVVLVNPPCN